MSGEAGAGTDMAGAAVETGDDGRAAGAAEAEHLLRAGAVLPPGTPDAGPRAVPLTTRAYRHPGLDDRVVVRLVAGELGAAEDMAAGFLGLEPDGEPVEVGLGVRQSLGFPEWVLVHHPRDGRQALGLVPELERVAKQAKTKPKAALTACQQIAGRLADSVPHFLPTFLEQAGRAFLDAENPAYAGQMFMRARDADRQHGLAVDEERLDAVFLEFALAGAVPVKVLSGYARELAARMPADEAYRRFRELCVRRTAGGIRPSVQMSTDLRKLAKAAGADVAVAEGAYLTELLALPATRRAAPGWWQAQRPALAALSRREPATRGTLLDLLPEDTGCAEFWLELLEECGATEGLWDGELPAGQRPSDGTVGWYLRFVEYRTPFYGAVARVPEFWALVERMAGQLRAELAASDPAGRLPVPYADVDLLDLLLSLDVPVADPKTETDGRAARLRVREWAGPGADRRDLRALEADARFRPAFRSGLDRFGDDADSFRRVAESPGGRPMVTEWMSGVARRAAPSTLPLMPEGLNRLGRLPGPVLALAEDEVRAVAGTDLTPLLVRTLRAGIFDELGWPAWEAAVEELMPEDNRNRLVVADAWPHLIVGGASQARVLDAEGAVLTHDLRIPDNEIGRHDDPGFHYVDGQLLVLWRSASDGRLHGYWHTAADRPAPIESANGGRRVRVRGVRVERLGHGLGPCTVPRPGGGRLTGGGVLYAGDTALPDEQPVTTDGERYWTLAKDAAGVVRLHELDPETGTTGDVGRPAFFAEATRDAPEGSRPAGGTLLPAPSAETGPGAHPVGGLFGRRVVRLPDGSLRCEDLAGNTVTLPPDAGRPARPLMFPGHDRPTGVGTSGAEIGLVDPEGGVTSRARMNGAPGAFAAGTALLPPENYWHCLRVRDPRGSEALRGIDDDTAATLLAAAVAQAEEARKAEQAGREREPSDRHDELPALIRKLLPAVTDDALVRGIAGVVGFAAEQQAALDAVAERLDSKAVVRRPAAEAVGPENELIGEALNGLADDCRFSADRSSSRSFVGQLQALKTVLGSPPEATADTAREAGAVAGTAAGTHLDGPPLPADRSDWDELLGSPAALAFRAAAVTTAPEQRAALTEVLAGLDTLGLTSAEDTGRWRVCRLRLGEKALAGPHGTAREPSWSGVLRLAGGAFLAVVRPGHWEMSGREFRVLFHDPAGRFAVPAPYTVASALREIGTGRPGGWTGAFRAELAARGPAPWFPAAAEEFARLTGVTPSVAALVVAGLPRVQTHAQGFLPTDVRDMLGLKIPNAALARDELRRVDVGVRRAVVAALLPAEPARLWTDGPDVAAAAEVWNSALGRRTPVLEETLLLVAEAVRAVRSSWTPEETLRALLDPSGEPRLAVDAVWRVDGDHVAPAGEDTTAFDAHVLTTVTAAAAWLAHRLPAGHPVRALLPGVLDAVRERLANPELMLGLGQYVHLPTFRNAAGAPTATGEGYERYGAVIMSTSDHRPQPGLRVALLDEAGGDPYLPVLRGTGDGYGYGPGRSADPGRLFPAEAGMRIARDPRFAALLGEPGDPAAGERDKDGTWYPQDPSRSVPDLVTEAAGEYGIGADAATLYLILLAMPDPTDTHVARWTGWKQRRGGAARLDAAREELAATELVVSATRTGARRSLFLPGGWTVTDSAALPLERWKLPLFDLVSAESAPLDVIAPTEPVADLYRRAWQRIREGDTPRFDQLRTRRAGRGGRA